jgi:fructose-1,6-bisphosphatase/inositol monophosphatase family enzyme
MAEPVDLGSALRVALEAAGTAVHLARTMSLGEVRTKRHAADVVTDVDVATERAVRVLVAEHFPEHHVLGEELGGEAWDGPTWYCDPVDGTTNLASGLPWTSFSLSLAVGSEPLVGVVADPWRGEVLFATKGGRAYRRVGGAEERVAVPVVDGLSGRVVMTEWAAHVPWPGMLELLAALGERHCTARVMGSGTLSVASVAAGRAAGAVISTFHPEDHLAAVLLCREAGAVVCDRDGGETAWPERGPFVAAPRGVVEELRALLP